MAVPRIIPNTVDLHFRYTFQNNLCENVYQFIYTVVPTAAALLSLATEVANAFLPKYQAMMPDDVQFTEVVCNDIGAAGRATATYVFPANTFGSRANDPIPGNVAANLVLKTGLRGRSKRGSKRISPFTEDEVSGNTLAGTLAVFLLDLALQIIIKRVTNAFTPAVGSMKLGSSQAITSVSLVDANSDSQKTRLNGRGR